MKKYLPYLLLLPLLLQACSEIGPTITLNNGNNNGGGEPGEQPKRVLIEEFTGVRCVNCPSGAAEIEGLLALYPDQLVAISIHAGFFAEPYAQNTQDFRTPDGNQLEALLGPVTSYPAAVVNRKLFAAETELPLTQTKWAGYIAQELQGEAPVIISIDRTYDAATRQLAISVKLDFVEGFSEPLKLSVALTENNVTNAQLTPSTSSSAPDMDYKHKHVLRDMLSNYAGDALEGSTAAGSSITKTFNTTLPNLWVEGNMSVVAFVSKASANTLDVIQAHEVKVTQ